MAEKIASINKFLIFKIENEEYGIDINRIREIIGIQKITPLPNASGSLKGVINLRGTIVPVIDVRQEFNMKQKEYDYETSIIVTQINEKLVGLIVDSVSEVLDIPPEAIEKLPEIEQRKENSFITGIAKAGDNIKILIDVEKLYKNHGQYNNLTN
ncbi:MAG: chemotaxis protein CheW [Candidatus Neomarinimicrobiota bacterium]|nr:purine-binding chemotaxis protein CheW [Candidatus Neomarinimicrobiota bacterium]MCD6099728.1 purine-binding chemotaxis protein CheW [Candidatus Neomarinimicrobiota bacterium]RKY50859.1 MAG: chemotaxis protein CheW [Candidatus Neomarinimicrobiota bacterium]